MKQPVKALATTTAVIGYLLWTAFVLICINIGIIYFIWILPSDEIYTVETEYGDTFTVRTDFMHKTSLEHRRSGLNIRINHEITAEDLTALCHSSELTVYMVDCFAVYDSGDGFKLFKGDLAENAALTQLIKQNLLSGDDFFRRNTEYFLNDRYFHDETVYMLKTLISGNSEYDDELARYGFKPDSGFNESIRGVARRWLTKGTSEGRQAA